MSSTIRISISERIRKQLDKAAKAEGVSRSEIVRGALRDYLFLRQFRGLRKSMVEEASRKGVHTDQDVFDRVS